MAQDTLSSVTWEAYDHYHEEKGSDWYWIVSIITISLTIVTIILGNILLGILIAVAGSVLMLVSTKQPEVVPYAVTTRGVRIAGRLYPYTTLESYFILEEDEAMPMLLVKSERWLMPLLTIPLPTEYLDEVEELLASRLPEEPMEEPIVHRFLELLGL